MSKGCKKQSVEVTQCIQPHDDNTESLRMWADAVSTIRIWHSLERIKHFFNVFLTFHYITLKFYVYLPSVV